MDIFASLHTGKMFSDFFKETIIRYSVLSVPVSLERVSKPVQMAVLFRTNFEVMSPLEPACH